MNVSRSAVWIVSGLVLVGGLSLGLLALLSPDETNEPGGGTAQFPSSGDGGAFGAGSFTDPETGEPIAEGGTGVQTPPVSSSSGAGEAYDPALYHLLDSDEDGIKDWEEILRGLDPFSQDTDGDGVLDGDEELGGSEDQILLAQETKTIKEIEQIVPGEDSQLVQEKDSPAPSITGVSPQNVSPGGVLTVNGSGFMEAGNTVYLSNTTFYNVPSQDGATLAVKIASPFEEIPSEFRVLSGYEGPPFTLPFYLTVENQNGVSNSVSFSLVLEDNI